MALLFAVPVLSVRIAERRRAVVVTLVVAVVIGVAIVVVSVISSETNCCKLSELIVR